MGHVSFSHDVRADRDLVSNARERSHPFDADHRARQGTEY